MSTTLGGFHDKFGAMSISSMPSASYNYKEVKDFKSHGFYEVAVKLVPNPFRKKNRKMYQVWQCGEAVWQ